MFSHTISRLHSSLSKLYKGMHACKVLFDGLKVTPVPAINLRLPSELPASLVRSAVTSRGIAATGVLTRFARPRGVAALTLPDTRLPASLDGFETLCAAVPGDVIELMSLLANDLSPAAAASASLSEM